MPDAEAAKPVTNFPPNAVHLVRTSQQLTMQLSQMADQKASILMGATFVVFTLAVGQARSGTLVLPLAILATFSFLSALLAVSAVLPRVGKAPPVKASVPLDWDFGGSDREPESAADDEPEPTESDAVPIGFQLLQDCPGGRCAVPASTSVSPSSATPRYATAASTQPTAPARRRIFEAKPVRSFLGRLFGRYSCR